MMSDKSIFKVLIKPLLIGFSLLVLSSCTVPEKVALSPISGFGGTGYKPSGFGGTGIVGTITDFGSIWVNGVEIEYDQNTQITSNLLDNDKLKVGEQVVLETVQNDEKTETTKISIYYPIAGKITHLSQDQMVLNNHFVIKTKIAKRDEGVNLKVGTFVAINGFEISSKHWVATRINKNPNHKVFYQEIPDLNFSKSVKQVLIESSSSQLKNWKAINGVTDKDQALINFERIIVIGRVGEYGNIQVDTIQPYGALPKKSSKKSMLDKYKSFYQSKKGSTGMSNNQGQGQGHKN